RMPCWLYLMSTSPTGSAQRGGLMAALHPDVPPARDGHADARSQAGAAPMVRNRRRRPVSMADVARHAGVSPQTVSRVSNGLDTVVESTRQRVLASMRELGYRPNSAARALKSGRFRTIGVIVFSLSSTG